MRPQGRIFCLGVCRPSEHCRSKCGSGLARECGGSVPNELTDTLHSRASPLPQGICGAVKIAYRSDISHNRFRLSLGTSLANLLAVAANSAAGFDRPTLLTNCYALHLSQAFFLCLRYRVAAVVRGIPSGMPGSLTTGRSTRVQLPPSSFDRERWRLHLSTEFHHD